MAAPRSVGDIFSRFVKICLQEQEKRSFLETKETQGIPPELDALIKSCTPEEISAVLAHSGGKSREEGAGCSGLELASMFLNQSSYDALVKNIKPRNSSAYLRSCVDREFLYYIMRDAEFLTGDAKRSANIAERLQNTPALKNWVNQMILETLRFPIIINEAARKIQQRGVYTNAHEMQRDLEVLVEGGIEEDAHDFDVAERFMHIILSLPAGALTEENIRTRLIEFFQIGRLDVENKESISGEYIDISTLIDKLGLAVISQVLPERIVGLDIPLLHYLVSKEPYEVYHNLFEQYDLIEIAPIIFAAKQNFPFIKRGTDFASQVASNEELEPEEKVRIVEFYTRCKYLSDPAKYIAEDPNNFMRLIQQNIPMEWDQIRHHDRWIAVLEEAISKGKELLAKNKFDAVMLDRLEGLCGLVYYAKFQALPAPADSKDAKRGEPVNLFDFAKAIEHWWSIKSPAGISNDLNRVIAMNFAGLKQEFLDQFPPPGKTQLAYTESNCLTKSQQHMRYAELNLAAAQTDQKERELQSPIVRGFFGMNEQKYKERLDSLPLEKLKQCFQSIRKENMRMSKADLLGGEAILQLIHDIESVCEKCLYRIKAKSDSSLIGLEDLPDTLTMISNQMLQVSEQMRKKASPEVLASINKMRTTISHYLGSAGVEQQYQAAVLAEAQSQLIKSQLQNLSDLANQLHGIQKQMTEKTPRDLGYIIDMDQRKDFLSEIGNGFKQISDSVLLLQNNNDYKHVLHLRDTINEVSRVINESKDKYKIDFVGLDEHFPFAETLDRLGSAINNLETSLAAHMPVEVVDRPYLP